MDYCQEHPEEISKIASVQKKVLEQTLLALPLQPTLEGGAAIVICFMGTHG